jgi:beta-mannanase
MFKIKSKLCLYLAHEMNGNWYPWSLGSTPNDYILAWRHVYDIFSNKSLDPTRLQWIWCVNSVDQGNYTAENYWVGDNYVDWMGIDGYNDGVYYGHPWAWPNQVFDNMIGRLRNLSSIKPIGITEYGTSSIRTKNTFDIPSKTEWLNLFCDYIDNNQIKMASYFNKDGPIADFAIFGGVRGDVVWNNFTAYTAYKNCLQSNEWIQPNNTNERLITDDQFAGRL